VTGDAVLVGGLAILERGAGALTGTPFCPGRPADAVTFDATTAPQMQIAMRPARRLIDPNEHTAKPWAHADQSLFDSPTR